MRVTFEKVLETNFLLFQKLNDDKNFQEFISDKMFEYVNYDLKSA